MPRKRKSKPLGAANDFHLEAAEHRLSEAYKEIAKLRVAPQRKEGCARIMERFQSLRFRMGEATAHLNSIDLKHKQERAKQAGSNLNSLQAGTADLWDTLGFQCTRKRGGVR